MSPQPVNLQVLHTLANDPRAFFVHITHSQQPSGWYWYDEILQDRGFSALVARQAVEAATTVCGGPCVWFDWLDPMFLNCRTLFDEVDTGPPIHLMQMYGTVQQAFDALKPSPYNDNQWLPQRSRVMRMLLEHVLNQSDALQSALVGSHPWPLAAVIARKAPAPDPRALASDQFWGIDIHSGTGQNTMGKLLRHYRDNVVASAPVTGDQAVARSVAMGAISLLTTEARLLSPDPTTQQQRCIVRISPQLPEGVTATIGVSCVVVVDTSGSMAPQMHMVRQMLSHLLTSGILDNTADEITFVQFADNARAAAEDGPNAALGPLDRNRQQALLAFIRGLEAYGSTNLSTGVLVGLEQLNLARANNTKCLCILTDGRPCGDPLLNGSSSAYSQRLLAKVKEIAEVGSVNVFPIGVQRSIDSAPLTDLATTYNGEFAYVATITEANSKCEEILHHMKRTVARNLTLRAEVSAGIIRGISTSCNLRTSNDTTFEVFIADQYDGETPRDVAFTLEVDSQCETVNVAYTLNFTDVTELPDGSQRTLRAVVNLPPSQLSLRPSKVYYDAVNGLRYMEAINTVTGMSDDRRAPAAALVGRGTRHGHCTSGMDSTSSTWFKALELQIVMGYLRGQTGDSFCSPLLLAKLDQAYEALNRSPAEGDHVSRALGSTRGGR